MGNFGEEGLDRSSSLVSSQINFEGKKGGGEGGRGAEAGGGGEEEDRVREGRKKSHADDSESNLAR